MPYIYILRDPRDNRVRYVGKANDIAQRMKQHLHCARHHHKTHRDNWIRSLLLAGHKPTADILEEVSVDGWADAERHWIAHYLAMGMPLTNMTSGGEAGPSCLGKKFGPFSVEHRAKISAARLGKKFGPFSEEHKAKISKANKGKIFSDDTRAKMKRARQGWYPPARLAEAVSRGVRGEGNSHAILTEAQVCEIRAIYGDNPNRPSYAKIGKMYGVTLGVIFRILKGKAWKHLL